MSPDRRFISRMPGIAFCLLVFCTAVTRDGTAGDETAKLLLRASGITDEDVKAAARKTELGLFDVYALAVKTTERLAIEGEYSVQARARRNQALGTLMPRVSLKASKSFPESTSRYVTPGQSSGINLYARQDIITGLDQWAGLSGASAEIRLRRHQLHFAAGTLLRDVAFDFYQVAQIGKSLSIQKEILSLYNKTLVELRRRVAVGRSRESEVLRTNSQVYKLLAEIKALEDSLANARRSLATLSCMPAEAVLVTEIDIPEPGFSRERISEFLERRYDVKAAAEQLEVAKSQVYAAWGGHLPSVYIEGTYRLYRFDKSSQTTRTRDYYAALGAELPLFTGGITVARVSEAESIRRQAELNLTRTTREARQDILDAWENYISSGQETEAFRKALTSAESNYRAVIDEYRLNLVTILDVLTSLTTLQGARDDYERTALQNRFDRIRLGIALNEFPGSGIDKLRAAREKTAG